MCCDVGNMLLGTRKLVLGPFCQHTPLLYGMHFKSYICFSFSFSCRLWSCVNWSECSVDLNRWRSCPFPCLNAASPSEGGSRSFFQLSIIYSWWAKSEGEGVSEHGTKALANRTASYPAYSLSTCFFLRQNSYVFHVWWRKRAGFCDYLHWVGFHSSPRVQNKLHFLVSALKRVQYIFFDTSVFFQNFLKL